MSKRFRTELAINLQTPSAPPPTPKNTTIRDFTMPEFKQKGLVLYFHPYNFFSQKILLLLYEKNLDFTSYAIDLSNGEQYSDWFLALNPKGDVPVLQDNSYVVHDSEHIISYIESKFTNPDYVSLKPKDINCKEFQRIQLLNDVIAKVPVGALSLGSFIHEDLKLLPKPPFIGPIRKACLANNEKVYDLLKKSVEEAEVHKTALLRKLDLQDRRKRLVYSRVEFQKILDIVQNVLTFMENELKGNARSEWLVGVDFTLADVNFGMLLSRLYQLGFENYYWSYGKLPNVESYFLRFKKRNAYQRLAPSNFDILKDIWQKTPSNYKIGAGAGVLGMAMFAAFTHK